MQIPKNLLKTEKYKIGYFYTTSLSIFTISYIKEMILIRKANWQRRECNGCKEYIVQSVDKNLATSNNRKI